VAVRETVLEPTVDLKRNFFTPRVGQVRIETVSVVKPASRAARRRRVNAALLVRILHLAFNSDPASTTDILV
jgi:hypothetical protein